LKQLRQMLDQNSAIWQAVGDLGGTLEATLIDRIGAGDTLICESLVRQVALMRAELGAESSPAIEQLAIDRAIVAWLHLQQAEKEHQAAESSSSKGRFHWKRKAQADKAFEASLKAVATLRKFRPGK